MWKCIYKVFWRNARMTKELRTYERMQKAIFDGAQEPVKQEPPFIPYGRCPRCNVTISNGMFDTPCPLCEALNDEV